MCTVSDEDIREVEVRTSNAKLRDAQFGRDERDERDETCTDGFHAAVSKCTSGRFQGSLDLMA